VVVIAVQEDGKRIGRIRLRRVADAAGESLEPAGWAMVEPGSTVRTDGWGGYNGLSALGYKHRVIEQAPHLGDNLLPMVNLAASLLKRWLLGTHQGGVQHAPLDYSLDEDTFRFNRRPSKSRGLLFDRLITQAIELGPVLGIELKSPPSGENSQESCA
jgi:hypothetical protein